MSSSRGAIGIGLQIAALVVVCSVGGLALSYWIAEGHRRIETESRGVADNALAYRNATVLEQRIRSWFITTDLLFSASTYHADAAITQADELLELLGAIRASHLASGSVADLEGLEMGIRGIRTVIEEVTVLGGEDRDEALNRMITRIDDFSMPIIDGVQNLLEDLAQRSEYAQIDLQQRRMDHRSTSVVAGALYLVLVLAMWFWTVLTLNRPLVALTRAARGSLEEDRPFRLSPSGPSEVRELTRRVSSLVTGLQASNETLEDKVAERTAALESANRSKSEFLANVSHEIRTPMTAILGYTGLMRDEAPDEAQREEYLDIIQLNGDHLLSIINDILDISKIEAGRMVIERIACSPFEIVEDVVSLMHVRASDKGLELQVAWETPVPERIVSDPTRLRQVLINLVGNAIKFTDQGSVTISVAMREIEGEECLAFDIRDTGVGMNADELSRLFRPFTQADASTTRKFGGTGLGLTISKKLAILLGGDLRASSTPGLGSTFHAVLRPGVVEGARRFDAPPTGRESRRVRKEQGEIAELVGRVLLAEDVAVNRRLISMVLERAGLEVDQVGNGLEAYERAMAAQREGEGYDILLLDMQMPVMDGYTAARRLRDEGYGSPIVALTAHSMGDDRDKCLGAGCDDYERKPIDRDSLLGTLARWIERDEG